jgi:2-polyprenyl-3-methyl-5-hydroxy-6-metoxy-1,4-benzoquinol methylase
MSCSRQRNPHFDDDRVVWNDAFSGEYNPVRYHEQFDEQWKLFLERKRGFYDHTGVETSDEYIDDHIREITGVEDYLLRKRWGPLSKIGKKVTGRGKRAARRGIGGRLYLEPKFPIGYFRGKRCLDIGCGAGRWTKTLVSLGAWVKAVDVSEHGLRSARRFTRDTEHLDLFDIIPKREDLHLAFDFTLCWGVIMCTHDPRLAFENVARTVKPGGQLYCMVYAPTYHASEFVLRSRRRYHRELKTAEERAAFLDELTANDRENTINYQDMLNTFYNWTISEATLEGWCSANGFSKPVFLNATEPHKAAHHILASKL